VDVILHSIDPVTFLGLRRLLIDRGCGVIAFDDRRMETNDA
jgi:hypothetical protein